MSAPQSPDGGIRYRPDDRCPLFSERLEAHIVAVTKGEQPNRGRFCGHCYTPLGRAADRCPHCATAVAERPPVGRVPPEVGEMLTEQRRTERWIVNGMAFAGLTIAIVVGLVVVLAIPALRDSLIWATVVYALILLFGGRTLAGVMGGYYGDRWAYARGRGRLLERWDEWVVERDRRPAARPPEDAADERRPPPEGAAN